MHENTAREVLADFLSGAHIPQVPLTLRRLEIEAIVTLLLAHDAHYARLPEFGGAVSDTAENGSEHGGLVR